MKRTLFLIISILVLAAEIAVMIGFAVSPTDVKQSAVDVNEAVRSVERDFYSLETHSNATDLDYAVIDNDGNVLYRTRSDISDSIHAAISHRDTILDITVDGNTVGKIIVYNDSAALQDTRKKTVAIVFACAIAVQCAVLIGYAVYMNSKIIKPFGKLKGFAERVASGNLDVPLEMDRQNIFGAFTESFDIMRSELKKARLAEAQAQQSKKELVAKLSHDIKTPVASIKAVSEVGFAVTRGKKDREYYTQIGTKADQINTLVTNLFSATLEELQQLTVAPTDMESSQIKVLLENADYMRRADIPEIPECLVYADRLRLQQVFDNIFANSYKYANTNISVAVAKADGCIEITIEDFGGGVPEDEIPLLKEKFKRGSNGADADGAGLGLYISDHFMREMSGALDIANGERGFKATVTVALSDNLRKN
ncbi:MAG: HAMP domain-containing histidine kinase [Roseburia sp.]|nr:HAMP domain-containing histidine kinase [Roseburia sp.]